LPCQKERVSCSAGVNRAGPELKGDLPGIALVGYGGIALEHVRALQSMGLPVRFVMGPDEQRACEFAAKHRIPRWGTRFEEVLNTTDVDAVVVTSPNEVHAEQTIACVDSGKHVLCEVPLATCYSDAERVVTAWKASGAVCMVCQTERFFESVAWLRDRVGSGDIDPLHLVSLMGLRRRHDHNYGWTGRLRRWTDNVIWHHGSHAVDTALWLLDDQPDRVSANSGRPEPVDGIPVDVSITLRTQAGRLATLSLSYSAMQPIEELVLIAEDATYVMKDFILCQASEPAPDASRAARALSVAVLAQDQLFIRSVMGQAAPSPTPAELLSRCDVLRTVETQVTEVLSEPDRST
jgi:2-hydroxy-4-carboxymuconate semialdehyde hemiacetal dehydrogenase